MQVSAALRLPMAFDRRYEGADGGRATMSAPLSGQPTGPSRVWYWVAGAAVVASVVWLAVGIFSGIRSFSRQVEGFQRVPVPGHAELRFDEPGGYTVYFEGLGAADQQVAIPSLAVGPSLTPVIGRALRLTIPATLVLFFGGAALAAVVAIRRSQARGPRPTLAPWAQPAHTGGVVSRSQPATRASLLGRPAVDAAGR
jgi:hypothetical protein